jgi:ADP-ribosylation factor related protein 1
MCKGCISTEGKSTLLESLKRVFTGKGLKPEQIPPTIGLNIGTFTVDGLSVVFWDVGGGVSIRSIWSNYYREADGVLFVVDSADSKKLDESRRTLAQVAEHGDLRTVPVLVMANKADLVDARSCDDIAKALAVEKFSQPHVVKSCSALREEGLEDGLRWLIEQVKQLPDRRAGAG